MMKVINLIISDIMNKCGFSVEFMTGATLDCVDPGYGYTLTHSQCTRAWYLTRDLITFTPLMTLSLGVISSQHSLHPGISAVIHQ